MTGPQPHYLTLFTHIVDYNYTASSLQMLLLTPSQQRCYLKTTNKSAKCQILKPFVFFCVQQLKGISSKCTLLKVGCHWVGKYTVCRLVRATLSPEILQAGAVKGLTR